MRLHLINAIFAIVIGDITSLFRARISAPLPDDELSRLTAETAAFDFALAHF
jgi:hypothetical protein